MRRFDKVKNIHKANLLNEVRYLESKGLLKESETNDVLSESSIDLRMSVLGLAKNNNGIFKSEKQASFLKLMIDERDGLIGHTEHGRPYLADYDDKGIIKITVGNPPELYWERKEQGILRPDDIKRIKSLQREIKQLENSNSEFDVYIELMGIHFGKLKGTTPKADMTGQEKMDTAMMRQMMNAAKVKTDSIKKK
jgi:hypothetical protein